MRPVKNSWLLIATVALISVIFVGGKTASESARKPVADDLLNVKEAAAAPSGKVYVLQYIDSYYGPYRYFIYTKDRRKTEFKPKVPLLSLQISKNDTLVTIYDHHIYILSPRGKKIIKKIPLPSSGKYGPEVGIRGFTVDNSWNTYICFCDTQKKRTVTSLVKVTPAGNVTELKTKSFPAFIGSIDDRLHMAVDAENNLYVPEESTGTFIIEKFDPNGRGEIVADGIPGSTNPSQLNVDIDKNIFVGFQGILTRYASGDKHGAIISSVEESGPFRATKSYEFARFGKTDLKLPNINYMWRLQGGRPLSTSMRKEMEEINDLLDKQTSTIQTDLRYGTEQNAPVKFGTPIKPYSINKELWTADYRLDPDSIDSLLTPEVNWWVPVLDSSGLPVSFAIVYKFRGHWKVDPSNYVTSETLELLGNRDNVVRYLADRGVRQVKTVKYVRFFPGGLKEELFNKHSSGFFFVDTQKGQCVFYVDDSLTEFGLEAGKIYPASAVFTIMAGPKGI